MSTGTRRDTEMKKDKEVVAMSSSSPNSNDDNSSEEDLVSLTSVRFSSRNTSSKYDFVKVNSSSSSSLSVSFPRKSESFENFLLQKQVKVWLGDNADHYYVLSRFLLSRMLTVTKVSIQFNILTLFICQVHQFFYFVG